MRLSKIMRHLVYAAIGLFFIAYGVPHLPHLALAESGLFDVLWLLFALLIVGANLFYFLGADQERVATRSVKASS